MDVNLQMIERAEVGVFLDIGANHGMYSRAMAEKGTRAYAFEPHPDNVTVLKRSLQGVQNAKVMEYAVSNMNGQSKMFDCPANPGGHTLSDKVAGKEVWSHRLDNFRFVRTRTLDSFAHDEGLIDSEGNVTLPITGIKIDVEGAEQRVLEGAAEVLMKNACVIALETHLTIDPVRIYELLDSYGYSVWDAEGNPVTELTFDRQYLCSNIVGFRP
jgi:FkbM family methyltransferase